MAGEEEGNKGRGWLLTYMSFTIAIVRHLGVLIILLCILPKNAGSLHQFDDDFRIFLELVYYFLSATLLNRNPSSGGIENICVTHHWCHRVVWILEPIRAVCGRTRYRLTVEYSYLPELQHDSGGCDEGHQKD